MTLSMELLNNAQPQAIIWNTQLVALKQKPLMHKKICPLTHMYNNQNRRTWCYSWRYNICGWHRDAEFLSISVDQGQSTNQIRSTGGGWPDPPDSPSDDFDGPKPPSNRSPSTLHHRLNQIDTFVNIHVMEPITCTARHTVKIVFIIQSILWYWVSRIVNFLCFNSFVLTFRAIFGRREGNKQIK